MQNFDKNIVPFTGNSSSGKKWLILTRILSENHHFLKVMIANCWKYGTGYCLRYHGVRVPFKLFCIIYWSIMLIHILNEITIIGGMGRVSHFGKVLNPGSHSNGYFGKLAILSEFSATFTIPQLTCKFCYILITFPLREDLTFHSGVNISNHSQI